MKPDKQLVAVLLKTDRSYRYSLGKDSKPEDDWADWWASYLLASTDFNQLTDRNWQQSDLSNALSALRNTYDQRQPKHHWSHFFALRLSN
jgi:hypothetical protein